MPIFSSEKLLLRVTQAFEDCGASTVLVSPPQQRHPRAFVVQANNQLVEPGYTSVSDPWRRRETPCR